MRTARRGLFVSALLLPLLAVSAEAQCPANPPLAHYTPGAPVHCPCFLAGEEVGAVFTPPAGDYPLEVISVSVYYMTQFGGGPTAQEAGVHLYNAGLPNPGPRLATYPAPMLADGVLNVFAFSSPVPVTSGPITATLEFLNQTSGGGPFTPSVAYDGDGCQGGGLNVIKTIPGGWSDACLAGTTGDWVIEITYRPCQSVVPVRTVTWGEVKRLSSVGSR